MSHKLLFDLATRRRYVKQTSDAGLPSGREAVAARIQQWLTMLDTSKLNESEAEGAFAASILVDLLGYVPQPSDPFSLWPKPSTLNAQANGTPDVMLGRFGGGEPHRWRVAGELKGPGAGLDTPRINNGLAETPVQQGFRYARSIIDVKWVLVSNMDEIRLYSVEDETRYERFRLSACVDSAGNPTDELDRLLACLHSDYLVADGHDSPMLRLLAKTTESQLAIATSFYDCYRTIRSDLIAAVKDAVADRDDIDADHAAVVVATQRLLDRLLFLYYCEDHPSDALLESDLVRRVTDAAWSLPSDDPTRVYKTLKRLFREADEGSPAGVSGIAANAFNGELFKHHPIIDEIDLPDTLHRRPYHAEMPDGSPRRINGVWGLHAFEFWTEVDEHLLGHIFEESLSDLTALTDGTEAPSEQTRLAERKRGGVFYTSSLLSTFVVDRALEHWLSANEPDDELPVVDQLTRRMDLLATAKAADLCCGSGAFLASYYRRVTHAIEELHKARLPEIGTIPLDLDAPARADILKNSIYGMDLLPQAAEIAKLSLWLRSTQPNEKVPSLGGNIISGDALQLATDALLGGGHGTFDMVLGNPPWGAQMDANLAEKAVAALGLDSGTTWDSWEVFVALSLRMLKDGGVLGLVLPDTLLYENKSPIREHLFTHGTVLEVHSLGPDWFGNTVRMGTSLLFVRKGVDPNPAPVTGVLVAGKARSEAINGRLLLSQVVAQRSRALPYDRSTAGNGYAVEPFRGAEDDTILATLDTNSSPLGDICDSGRGEEINKAGLLWECPNCLRLNTPGRKSKKDYRPTICRNCEHELSDANTTDRYIIVDAATASTVPWIDGDAFERRWQRVWPTGHLDLSTDWPFKDATNYNGEKVLIRQAGVGLTASIDDTGARVPQSVYWYRLNHAAQTTGYDHRYLLAVLLSRTAGYWTFKRYSEVDVARAFAKVTHTRLRSLPVPLVDFADTATKKLHDRIVDNADKLLDGTAILGGVEDLAIEHDLRTLWGLTPSQGAHINSAFYDIDSGGQVIRELFPSGPPPAPTADPTT